MLNRSDFNKIIYSDDPISFSFFITILNYFDIYKDELDIKELKILVDKCEECRVYLNANSTNDPMTRESINPNIYEYLEQRTIEDNKNKKDIIVWKQDYQDAHVCNA